MDEHVVKVSAVVHRRQSSHEFVVVNEHGVHFNHLEGHQQHVDGSQGSEHTIEVEEQEVFVSFINKTLHGDDLAARHLPLRAETNDLFERVKDGLIFVRLINLAVPGTIDEKAVNKGTTLNIYQMNENLNCVLRAAPIIGLHLVNIGAKDIFDGR